MSFVRLEHAACALLLASFSATAAAQIDPKVEAGQHFDRGVALAKQKAYLQAIGELNRAYELSPHYTVMYNLGQAYVAIERPVFAVEALRRYLAGGKDQIPAARRKQVEATIAAQERRIATLTLTAELAGAMVRVDGLEHGRTPLAAPIRLAAGHHMLEAFLPGYGPWEQKVELAGKEARTIEIRFVPLTPMPPAAPIALAPAPVAQPVPPQAVYPTAPPAVAYAAPSPAPTPSPAAIAPAPTTSPVAGVAATRPPGKGRGRTIAAVVVGGVGLGSLVTGSVFGLRAFSKKSSSDSLCPHEQCSVEGVRLNDEARTAATVSTITFSAGLACVAVATYLLLTPRRPSGGTPGTVAQRTYFAPAAGPGQAGVIVGGVW